MGNLLDKANLTWPMFQKTQDTEEQKKKKKMMMMMMSKKNLHLKVFKMQPQIHLERVDKYLISLYATQT